MFVESEAFRPIAENCVLLLRVVINKKMEKVLLQLWILFLKKNKALYYKEPLYNRKLQDLLATASQMAMYIIFQLHVCQPSPRARESEKP